MKITEKQMETIINGVKAYETVNEENISFVNENKFSYIEGNLYVVIDTGKNTIDYESSYYTFNEEDLERTLDFFGGMI